MGYALLNLVIFRDVTEKVGVGDKEGGEKVVSVKGVVEVA